MQATCYVGQRLGLRSRPAVPWTAHANRRITQLKLMEGRLHQLPGQHRKADLTIKQSLSTLLVRPSPGALGETSLQGPPYSIHHALQLAQLRRRVICPLQVSSCYCSLVGGLAWFGLLAFGVISEQIKTRREIAAEAEGTKASSLPKSCAPDHLNTGR